jgi:hypothetical protein
MFTRRVVSTARGLMRVTSKVGVLLTAALFLSAGTASAQSIRTQGWTSGWDNFSEPLDFTKSKINWTVFQRNQLVVNYNLVGATPRKLYQVGIVFFCTTFPATFGQFPNDMPGGGACASATRQSITKTIASIETGVVTTDINGNGSFAVVIGPIAAGTYNLEFFARDGAGCNLIGGAGSTASSCAVDFQSPGPFGTGTQITIQ